MTKTVHGKVHGKTIELEEDLGVAEGQQVEVHVKLIAPAASAGTTALFPPPASVEIAPGIRRSQEAFWRDLPRLLETKKNRGKWVCYHGDQRIGIAATPVPLLRECLRRGLKRDEYDLDIIQARALPPWEPEEVEPLGPWHFDDVPPQV